MEQCFVPLVITSSLLLASFGLAAWQDNIQPKLYIQLSPDDDVYKFVGNSNGSDYFRTVVRDGDSLLLGGRQTLYNLSVSTLMLRHSLIWESSSGDHSTCERKGKNSTLCQNYIRIVVKTGVSSYYMCGTNAFNPKCRIFNITANGQYSLGEEEGGVAICPFDPRHNSTALYVGPAKDNIHDNFYSATAADFSGIDSAIFRIPLRTEQYGASQLNSPNFVNSLAYDDYVYFFFREIGNEYSNCGEAVFSRVGRVCANDSGSDRTSQWTTFSKARLNCSVPGNFQFYFNEIQSATNVVDGQYGETSASLVYATFTTPPNSIWGSAVCAFSMQDILNAFDGSFRDLSDLKKVPDSMVPKPRPGRCQTRAKNITQYDVDINFRFMKKHPLMASSVPSFFGQPILIRTLYHNRFTQIAVDPQVKVPGGKAYDVLFIGTDNGKVLRVVNTVSSDTRYGVGAVVIEELQLFGVHVPIRSLKVVRWGKRHENFARLIATTDDEVQSIALHRCDHPRIRSCSDCVGMQDPYCAWDPAQSRCRARNATTLNWLNANLFYQSVTTGQSSNCSLGPTDIHSNVGGSYQPTDGIGGGVSGSNQFPDQFLHHHHQDQPTNDMYDIIHNENSRNGRIGGGGGGSGLNPALDGGRSGRAGGGHRGMPPTIDGGDGDPSVAATDILTAQYSVDTLIMAVLTGALSALCVGFISGYLCGRKCRKDDDDNLPYPDTEYEYFEQRQNMNSSMPLFRIQTEPKLLPQEEVTYAEPVLMPQQSPPHPHHQSNHPHHNNSANVHLSKNNSTLRKDHHPQLMNNIQPPPSEAVFLGYQGGDGGGGGGGYRENFNATRGRDNFGTLRSHQLQGENNYNRRGGDGYSTTRSVKKVYL